MRASVQEQTGGAGANEVAAKFQRLNWGVAHNLQHDLGTDLWLMVRDERRFDLGLLVGVQAKAGPTWFSQPHLDDAGVVTGWWFYESDRKHFDAWIAHAVPHLIVLHDMDSATSFWAHVTADAVQSTGVGAKILVPRIQTVDDACLPALLDVASAGRPASQWEGSAWTGAVSLAPKDRLRHALIAPRLLAPHRNAGFGIKPRPDQLVALLAQARVREVEIFGDRHAEVPTLTEAATSAEWNWRFVAAFARMLTDGETDWLAAATADAEDSSQRAAASIVVAAAHLAEARPEEAIETLEAALHIDDAEPVDHAWLTAQLARAYAEVGRLDDARNCALRSQPIRSTHPDDVTAGAITAAAASLVFNTSEWQDGKVADLIQASDTASSWWRTQTLSWGLTSALDSSYRAWSRDTAVFIGGPDNGHNDLLSAALGATHACDHGGWRHLATILAKSSLVQHRRTSAPAEVADLLTSLVHTGDSKALGLATSHIVNGGPATAATQAARDINLTISTHTTAQAALILLQRAGDVIDLDTANSTVEWLLNTIADPTAFIQRTWPRYSLVHQLTATLAGVVRASSPEYGLRVLDMVLGLPPQSDQADAHAWAGVIRAVPRGIWTSAHNAAATQRATGDHWELKLPLLGIAAPSDDAANQLLLSELKAGSLVALTHLADVRSLPAETAAALIDAAARTCADDIALARRGGHATRSVDAAHALTILNLWHPQVANWNALIELLGEALVRGEHKIAALRALTTAVERLPPGLTAELASVATGIVDQPERPNPFDEPDHDERATAQSLAVVLDPELAATVDIGPHLRGDDAQREAAAYLAAKLGRAEDTGILTALTTDQTPNVRAAAAAALASLVGKDRGGNQALLALTAAIPDPGTLVARAVINVLASRACLQCWVGLRADAVWHDAHGGAQR